MLPPLATELEAANVALSLIGERALAALDDSRTAGREIRLQFGRVRDGLLRETAWNFATTRSTPAASTAAPAPGFSWRYALPEDCLLVRAVPGLSAGEWSVEGAAAETDGLLRWLDTRAPVSSVVYTRRVGEPARWDPAFQAVFCHLLAAAIAPRLSRDPAAVARNRAAADELMPRAKRTDAGEQARQVIGRATSWTEARR